MTGSLELGRGAAVLTFTPMREQDLDTVAAIERTLFDFPWSRTNFADSIAAGYLCRVMWHGHDMAGYAVMMCVLDEAHLLNISVASGFQRRGLGWRLLRHLGREACQHGAERLFLEVRPSNDAARALYARAGFGTIGRRPRYYPAHEGREDAIIMTADIDGDWLS
ncbi:ribosomal protein S18-alanine N-acetyltransferase [Methyloversatilis thermotolerans]|uniref:ribosomal protein S18-alanine N-acetyltransferase n=1 Tax=Methyloversatilis thermotolerans TaxID=1346290 RepID=UPI00037B99F1|nr:ribosomal protein S18-alanine N-acetyltransferase [Methyloversatilis thermotolerans]